MTNGNRHLWMLLLLHLMQSLVPCSGQPPLPYNPHTHLRLFRTPSSSWAQIPPPSEPPSTFNRGDHALLWCMPLIVGFEIVLQACFPPWLVYRAMGEGDKFHLTHCRLLYNVFMCPIFHEQSLNTRTELGLTQTHCCTMGWRIRIWHVSLYSQEIFLVFPKKVFHSWLVFR